MVHAIAVARLLTTVATYYGARAHVHVVGVLRQANRHALLAIVLPPPPYRRSSFAVLREMALPTFGNGTMYRNARVPSFP